MRAETPPGQIAHFRIYPERGLSRLFFRVRIFRTVAQMQWYLRHGHERHGGCYPRPPGRHCKGMCSTYTRYRVSSPQRRRTTPELGEIVLAANYTGTRIVAHECTHAALGWARRRGLDVRDQGRGRYISGAEERLCGVLGDLAGQIARQLWDRGIAT